MPARPIVGLVALLFAGACAEAAPRVAGPAASDSVSFSDGLPPDGAGPLGSSPGASASAAPPLPALPVGVVECEAADGPSFGDDKPSVDDVTRAIEAAGDKACLSKALRVEAIRACAARVGAATVRISTDDLKGASGCEVTIHGAREAGRRWIVFSTFYREKNATFWGAATSVEVTPTTAALYVSTLTPEQAPLCPESGSTGDIAPKDMPQGWSGLTGSLHAFLCSGK